MKKIFLLGIILIPGTIFGAETTVEPEVKKTPGEGSPFEYSIPGFDDGRLDKSGKNVNGIEIRGIIRKKQGEPVAAIFVCDNKRTVMVRKGDVIRVEPHNKEAGIGETYLQIKSISNNEIEIVQQERPDRVIKIR